MQDAGQKAVRNATVDVIVEYRLLTSGKTDGNGNVTLQAPVDAPVDWVTARCDHIGFDYYENYSSFQSLARLDAPTKIDLVLNGSREVQVTMVDSKNEPVADGRVMPWTFKKQGKLHRINLSGRKLGITDESGIVRFAWLPTDLESRITFITSHPQYYCPKYPRLIEGGEVNLTANVLDPEQATH